MVFSRIPVFDDKNEVKYVAVFAQDMTKLKETSKALTESEAKLEIFTEKAPLGIFVADNNGRYLEVNEAASLLSGYTKKSS